MTIMSNPIPTKNRKGIDALTGIKSSLGQMRSIVALMYLLYIVNGRKGHILYSKKASDSKLTIDDSLLENIESYLGASNLKDIIINNPLFDKQFEPLYVGITLLYRLGKITMPGQTSTTVERTGGRRFPKEIFFSNNMVYLDLILQGFSKDVLTKSLIEWLKNDTASNADFELRTTSFLSLTSIYTQFKIRPEENKEIFFQTEGLYSALEAGQPDLRLNEIHEFVGPTRIYNNILKDGLDPWLNLKRDGSIVFSDIDNPSPKTIAEIISTSLEISCVRKDEGTNCSIDENECTEKSSSQLIYYGCPGTGKSHKVKKLTEGLDNEKIIKFDDGRINVFRTTFHPDYDYSTFVGCYKPVKEDEKLDYRFVPQVFTNAYVTARKHPETPVYLIIEEINRGNCAQIFGDLFQLLDRENGVSKFPIDAEEELMKYLRDIAKLDEYSKIELPANFNIYATMNTSDQSLFPMDSAFKRRWEMKFVKIDYTNKDADYTFTVEGKDYHWLEYLPYINDKITLATDSEDKQMGEFFIRSKMTSTEFKNKVMFYLWNDVCKDLYTGKNSPQSFFFRDIYGVPFKFTELFNEVSDNASAEDKKDPRKNGDLLLEGFLYFVRNGKKTASKAETPTTPVTEDGEGETEQTDE